MSLSMHDKKSGLMSQGMEDKPLILVVDDQVQNIELLEAHLVPQGYEIIMAASGEEALEKLAGNRIDLVLLDVMMPGMDGFEVTRRIRRDDMHRQLPIILVTVLRETEDRVRGIEAGCDDFISKPFDKLELLARVRALLKIKAYNDLKSNYRKELESEVARRTRDLAVLNAGLEAKVAERTSDLEKEKQKIQEMNDALTGKSIELENEKEKLRDRNKIMEFDLDMARTIQKCFIPGKSPAPYISFLYKPMEKVGGDFFDFIRVPGDDRIGIFISDVSGHGVPAAFITAMIKSSILQNFSNSASPSSVLETLNDILVDQSADNFITTFVGNYKPGTREFVYSNAGHNPPYIIDDAAIGYLSIKNNAPPLAIMSNSELHSMKKRFIDESVILQKGSKLILYTDGLTEAININNDKETREKNFESENLNTSFRAHFAKPAALFLEGVYRDLVDFRGSDDFDDDVCVICVDVE
jgi:serine phosphatase RsbU (regulator of sigma subunit)